MYMQKYIMVFLVIISMNNYTMDNTVKVVWKDFHKIIKKRVDFFKTQSKLSGYFKEFNDLKPYKSCSGKQGSKVNEFFLFVNSKIKRCCIEGVKPSTDEIVPILNFYNTLNMANKKFKIQEQYLLDMCNTKFDRPLDDKEKQHIFLETKTSNISNIDIDLVRLKLNLSGIFCIWTKFFKEVSKKTIVHYYHQVNEIGQIITKEDGTSMLDIDNK